MEGSFTSQTILIFLNQWVNRECQGQWCKQSFFILKNTNQVKFEFNNIQKFPMSLAWIVRTIYDDTSFSYAWGKAILCDLTDAAVLAVCLVSEKKDYYHDDDDEWMKEMLPTSTSTTVIYSPQSLWIVLFTLPDFHKWQAQGPVPPV